MKNKIFNAVDKIINGVIDCSGNIIAEYKDLTSAVGKLYIEDRQKDEMESLYKELVAARKKISGLAINFKDPDTDFMGRLAEYLDALRKFLRDVFYKRTGTTSAVISDEILSQIVESDTQPVPERNTYFRTGASTVRVGLGNPMILESLYITKLQHDDFNALVDRLHIEEGSALYLLYSEIFATKVERLFKDIEILYHKEFYKIIDFDEKNYQFVARRETDLGSLEIINAFDLYEKIVYGVSGDENTKTKCLVIGEVEDGSKKILSDMLKENAVNNVELKYMEKRTDIHESVSSCDKFLKLVENYDKIFVLDCPDIYFDSVLQLKTDEVQILNRASANICRITDVDAVSGTRNFSNENAFADIYYRVQNYLIRPDMRNSKRIRSINRGFLSFIDTYFKCDEWGNTINHKLNGKEVYVLVSDIDDLSGDLYDSYNYVRVEKYNLKECRTIKYSKRQPPAFDSSDMTVEMTFYKILKSLSGSADFYCKMTGLQGNSNPAKAIKTAQDTVIEMSYRPIKAGSRFENIFGISIRISLPFATDDDTGGYEKYKEILETILSEMAVFYRDDKDEDKISNKILLDGYKNAIADVLFSCACCFNDLLFQFLYERGMSRSLIRGNADFVIDRPPRFHRYVRIRGTDREEASSYSYKRTAHTLIGELSSPYYRDSDIISHIRQTVLNKEDINLYVKNIRKACENLDYTGNGLYSRLDRYDG